MRSRPQREVMTVVGPLRDLDEEKEADVLRLRQSRRQRGASMVELGLVLFILLLLVAAVADFGRVFNSYVVITNASREGARYASRVSWREDRIRDAARQEAVGSSVDPDELIIEIHPDPASITTDELYRPITVTVRYTVPTIIANIAGFGELPLRAQTQMVVFRTDP